MRPAEYLRLVRRRWWVLPLVAVLGVGAAFATRPGPRPAFGFFPIPTYHAKHVMVSKPIASSVNPNVDYDRLALLATRGDGPLNVVNTLDLGGHETAVESDPPLPRGVPESKGRPRGTQLPGVYVTAEPNSIAGSLTITATTNDPRRAIATANAIAFELTILLNRPPVPVVAPTAVLDTPGQINALLRQRSDTFRQIHQLEPALVIARLRQQVDTVRRLRRLHLPLILSAGVGSAPAVQTLLDQRAALSRRIAELDKQLLGLIQSGPSNAQLVTLSPASLETTPGFLPSAPPAPVVLSSGWPRLGLGGGIGLLVGVLVLLLWEVVRPRIRDVRSAEGAARMPLVAEIPRVKPATKTEWLRVAAAEEPSSPLAEAYRDVRTSLLAMWPRHPANVNGSGKYNGSGPPLRTLLVTSPGPNEGKSTSVVNLAATFAETGKSVIILDADFLRPTLHRYFHRAASPNLGGLDSHLTGIDLELVLQETGVPGVRFAAAPPLSPPARGLAVARAAAAAATELADIVILDSPPVLAASTASDLATMADATLLVVRSDWTRRRSAVAAAEHLRRIEARVIGVVLVGVEHSARSEFYGYYSERGKRDDAQRRLRPSPRRRRARRRAAAAVNPAGTTPSAAVRSPVVDLIDAESWSVHQPSNPAPRSEAGNTAEARDDDRPRA